MREKRQLLGGLWVFFSSLESDHGVVTANVKLSIRATKSVAKKKKRSSCGVNLIMIVNYKFAKLLNLNKAPKKHSDELCIDHILTSARN